MRDKCSTGIICGTSVVQESDAGQRTSGESATSAATAKADEELLLRTARTVYRGLQQLGRLQGAAAAHPLRDLVAGVRPDVLQEQPPPTYPSQACMLSRLKVTVSPVQFLPALLVRT